MENIKEIAERACEAALTAWISGEFNTMATAFILPDADIASAKKKAKKGLESALQTYQEMRSLIDEVSTQK